jgi:dephospho-CoA kinase
MLRLKKIAITGGVASGKSTVCRLLQELGAYVVNADLIVHELLTPQTEIGQRVIQMLGADIVSAGVIDRKRVAERVFVNPSLLQALEQLIHPAVIQRIEESYREVSKQGIASLFVVEMPLLFEIGAEKTYDHVVAILTEESLAKQRWIEAGLPPEEYARRMHRQIQPSHKALRAHFTISNNGSIQDLRNQVVALYKTLQKI